MKLYWITENGNEWLTEFLPSAEFPEGLKGMLEGYVTRTKEQAASLVDGWSRSGEEVSLSPCGEGDCIGETQAISMAIGLIEAKPYSAQTVNELIEESRMDDLALERRTLDETNQLIATEEYINEGPR